MSMTRPSQLVAAFIVFALFVAGCGREDDRGGAEAPRFGEVTTVVVIVNPVINDGSSVTDEGDGVRADIPIALNSPEDYSTRTDATGLAVLEGVPVGEWMLMVGDGEVPLEIHAEGELYDVVVTLNGDDASHLIPPVRYPIGGDVVFLSDGDSLEDALADDRIIFLEAGVYDGGFEVREDNLLIFGDWHPDDGPLAVIDGDITVRGEPNRFRSIDLRGTITSRANNFSMSFSRVDGADITGQGVSLIRNDFHDDADTTVPSDDAVLADNSGI